MAIHHDQQYLIIFHFFAFVVIGYANFYAISNFSPPIWGGIFVFLTQWGHNFNHLYWIVTLFNDYQVLTEKKKETVWSTNVRQTLFSLTFILATIVCMLFWALIAVEPTLVIPKGGEKFYPFWLSLVQHLATFVFILIELLVNEQRNLSLITESKIVGGFIGAYVVWMHVVACQDKFPYPFQRFMPWWGHVIFNAAAVGLALAVMYLKRTAISKLWHP